MTFLCCLWLRRRLDDETWWREYKPDPVILHDAGFMIPLQPWEQSGVAGCQRLFFFQSALPDSRPPVFLHGWLSMQMSIFLSGHLKLWSEASSCCSYPQSVMHMMVLVAAQLKSTNQIRTLALLRASLWTSEYVLFSLQRKCTCTDLKFTL